MPFLGLLEMNSVNQEIYDALLLMQHRGQDATGIVTAHGKKINVVRGNGLVGMFSEQETCVI